MKRRTFLGTVAAGAGVLAAPRLGRDAAASTLRFVPAQDLALLDPIQSPPGSMIMRSCLVFDTLYGLDESYKAQPPMVEGHVIEDDGKTWKLALRDWLGFPNGEPARTCDVIASRQRWGKRDTFGQTLFSVTDELSAPSDKVVQFRLKKTVLDDPRCAGQDRRLFRDHRTRASDTDRTDRGHAGVLIGSGPRAMFGWPDSPRLEELRWQWPDGPDVAEQQRICREIQAFQDVPYYRSASSIRQLPTARAEPVCRMATRCFAV
jgi:hypothetical protein